MKWMDETTMKSYIIAVLYTFYQNEIGKNLYIYLYMLSTLVAFRMYMIGKVMIQKAYCV